MVTLKIRKQQPVVQRRDRCQSAPGDAEACAQSGPQGPRANDQLLRGEGEGIHHKTVVVGAVEVRVRDGGGRANARAHNRRRLYAGRLRLAVVRDRSAKALVPFVTANVVKGARVKTDAHVALRRDRVARRCPGSRGRTAVRRNGNVRRGRRIRGALREEARPGCVASNRCGLNFARPCTFAAMPRIGATHDGTTRALSRG
jgi:hypothetical protein